MWLSPPTTTMGTVTPWFIISPKDVQKTCSKWMLRKFWKLQVVDLNQTSRRLHKYLNMFETIITQEIPLKKCQPLFFLVLVKRTQDSILNGQNYDCRDITKLWNSLDVDCTIWAAVNDVTLTLEHLKSSVVCGWMVWATVESQNSGELFTGMCNKRFHVQPLSKEEENFFFFSVLAKKASDVCPVLLSRQHCNVHAYIAEQVCSADVGQSLTVGFISAPRGMAWSMRGDITTWWKSRIIALNNRLLSCFYQTIR